LYSVRIIPRAQRDLDALPADRFRSVHRAILGLEREPRGQQTVKLTKEEGYRLRAGDYRILYRIDDATRYVYVYRIKHRRDAYR